MPNTRTAAAGLPPLTDVIRPDSPRYDSARQSFNLTADLRPAAVCVVERVEQVQAVLEYARDRGLHVAAMTTGHLATAMPDLSDTILLRLQLHRGTVTINPLGATARIRAGARWDDVIAAAAPFGLTAMHGSAPTVGVMGYLLGGGLSWYGRRHGLAVNHVTTFEVVTADGRPRRVDAAHEPDLFHALRGGGGGFAVVTAVETGLLPYAEVTAGTLFFAADHAPALLRAWRDWGRDAPDTIMSVARVMTLPRLPEVPAPLRDTRIIRFDATALRPSDADGLTRALCRTAPPILGGFDLMPSAAVARLQQDPEHPVSARAEGLLLERLEDAAIEAFLTPLLPGSPLLIGELRHLGGALATPPPGAGARGHLDGAYSALVAGVVDGSPEAADVAASVERSLAAVRPWATAVNYANFAEQSGSLAGCLPEQELRRLRMVKDRVDPGGLLVGAHALP